jgi:hypothetical protein
MVVDSVCRSWLRLLDIAKAHPAVRRGLAAALRMPWPAVVSEAFKRVSVAVEASGLHERASGGPGRHNQKR